MSSKSYYEVFARLSFAEKNHLVSKGLFVYSRRHCGIEATIEKSVGINFQSTLITNFPVLFPVVGPFEAIILSGNDYLRMVHASRVTSINDLLRTL